MQWWQKGLIAASILTTTGLAVFILGGYFIDGTVKLETSARVDVPPEQVFDYLDNTDGVVAWWSAVPTKPGYPEMKIVELRPEPLTIAFQARHQTFEDWTLIEASRPEHVVWKVDFQSFEVVRTIRLEADGSGTMVHWSETGEITNPVLRWFMLLPQDDVLDNFHGAIAALEKAAQKG